MRPGWNVGAVALARSIYENRAFDGLPHLAEMRKSGVEASDVLAHLEQPLIRVRGCWALDLPSGEG